VVDPHLLVPARVLWILTPAYVANAFATFPRGRGPAMDFGRRWRDGRRVFGASKTWSGFWAGTLGALPLGLLQAWLILIAPPSLQLVPLFAPSVLAAVPVVLVLSGGALVGDAMGSFFKRRLGLVSGARALVLDQLPFVSVPIALGVGLYPAVFIPTFASLEAILWVLLFTVGLHWSFNWVGYWIGAKKVPW
jgi:CDP-2,3-bis-(O-geranylgeranyl)-sn-glycerol synthase